MIDDSERREVARRLRELSGDSTYPDLIGVIADRDGWYPAADAADRLADLIEPPTQCPYYHSDRHRCSAYDDVVDRDALLALADKLECDGECDGCDMSDGIWCDAQGYAARRIREALGVVE